MKYIIHIFIKIWPYHIYIKQIILIKMIYACMNQLCVIKAETLISMSEAMKVQQRFPTI